MVAAPDYASVCFYHPRMRRGNCFSSICLCVCPSAVTFETFDLEISFGTQVLNYLGQVRVSMLPGQGQSYISRNLCVCPVRGYKFRTL